MRKIQFILFVIVIFSIITSSTASAADIILSDNINYTAQDGDVLTGSTSGTVTIANNAKITLSDVTITGGIVCAGTAEITLAGTNNVSGATYKAGIQIGGSGTTLTIKGNGSLTANGGENSAGIGLSRAWKVNATGGDIVIEGGNITATGDGMGAGIGTGVSYGNGTDNTATIGNITIKGGTVRAIGGTNNSYPGNGIGKGGAYSYGHAVVGTITIYDGIDMVDASSISESVTYMHVENETEADVTANASTYFTIIEDGNRRVIAPKDDNDYTITIANGIEHGTLTGAATAKYMEEVTITATPDFGYCLSRLVVKDAQNNDVESTDNSFFMPKSNVTVSAVFEQGTHGTTEFKWFYKTGPEPEDIVLETIYDGVTTVNIQNRGMMYRIWKYEGNTDYQFLLDNNTGDANIPYAGGTGEFYESGNPTTNFVFPYDGETGYYDITMTDVGNGKWNVSILKTAGQMDVVPDQTYTGSAITPEPTVIAGSFNLTKGTDYVYSYTNNTNVGTAKVRATFQGTYAWLGYVEKEFTILPSTVIVNVTGNGTVTYNDKVATNGEVIGVVADKGTDVTLTLAPENGYAVSIEYGYTNSGTTASGFKLPINGTTATLTVPNDLKDGTYVNLTVTFVSALAGGADEASAVALTGNTVTDLAGGWYKVDSNITFDHTLNLLGDTHLIIDDGKTMTVNTATSEGILSDYTLFVSGEGTLSVATTAGDGIAVCVGNYVQTGATVTVNGYIGIRCYDSFDTLGFDNDFTFSGGQLTATGSGGGGIWADNDITLSCTNATDFIQASSYSSVFSAVKIAEGNALTDGTEASNGMNGYSGTLTYEQRIAIGGKTLHRAVTTSYVEASGTLHENVIAIPLDNTMTTLAAGWYVVNSDVAYTGNVTLSGNVKLILGDGKTMSVTNTGTGNEDFAIYGDSGSLHIYGQSQGTGALTATANSSVTIKVDDYITINGGTVTATSTSDVGIYGIDGVTINGGTVNANGIYADGDITINGGKVTNNSPGIRSNNGTIILGLSNATDYITAESYNGAVKVADGQTLVDDGGNIWSGTLSNDDLQNSLLNKTLRPVMGVVLTKDGSGNISAEFDGTSLETVSIPVNITVNSVTLNRTFTWDKCATLMLPFSLGDGQSLNGGILYKFDGVNNGEGDWVATLSEFTSPLKANTPYLIKPNGHMTDDKITFDLNGGTVTLNTTTAGEDSNEKDDLWDFIGTYSYIKWTTVTGDQDYSAEREAEIGKVYGFAAVEKTGIHVGDFVRVASGAKIRPMCAYLKWKGSIPNNARALTRGAANDDTELPQRITVKLVSASGETTAIGTLDTTTGEVSFDSEAWYTLDGVRLSGKPTKKGLYINNGKKIVIR